MNAKPSEVLHMEGLLLLKISHNRIQKISFSGLAMNTAPQCQS